MKKKHILEVGCQTVEVNITPEMLPLDGFSSVHDPLHVRVILFHSDIWIALVSIEITSLFEETQKKMIRLIHQITGIVPEHIWLTLSHSFGGPHIWPAPAAGQLDLPRPGHALRTQDEIARCAMLEEAYLNALQEGLKKALDSMQEAVIGSGSGSCTVNASRNVMTKDGWWLGTSCSEHCDHGLHVLRIDGIDQSPIASIFTYGVRSCVLSRIKGADGGGVISSDLTGRAASFIEETYGSDYTSVCLCSSAADQEPLLKAISYAVNPDGELFDTSILTLASAEALLEGQGIRLGAEVLNVLSSICEMKDLAEIKIGETECLVELKQMNRDLSALKPARMACFERTGEQLQKIYALNLGKFNLIGLWPEIDGTMAETIASWIPGEVSSAAICVNGCGKCMPCLEAYQNVKYQCLNSPYMPGAAERVMSAAKELLEKIKK